VNVVQPITDIEVVRDISNYLQIRSDRNYVMFLIGIYTGLRISDIRKLRVRDLKGKTHLEIISQKTDKKMRIAINDKLKKVLDIYLIGKDDYEYILKSRQGDNRPITNNQAYVILSDAAHALGLDNIGTHSMRKTFGYHLYQKTKDIVLVKELLSHSDIEITKRYIGLVQRSKDVAVNDLSF
jgi:integrase